MNLPKLTARRITSIVLIVVSIGLFAVSMSGFGAKPRYVDNEFLWRAQKTLIVFWPIYVLFIIAVASFFVVARPRVHTLLLWIYGLVASALLAIFSVLLMFA